MIALLALALQADVLIERLGDDDIVERERASQALIELGPAARPALEKALQGGDPEIHARIASILGEILLAERQARSLGKPWRVDVPAGEHALQDLVEAVRARTGATIRIPDALRPARVRLEAKDVLFMDFLDRLCRAQGGLAAAPPASPEDVALVEGLPWDGPALYSGAFKVCIERLRLERRDPYGPGFERGSLLLALTWQPNVRPIQGDRAVFAVEEIRGDDGRALEVEPRAADLYGSSNLASDGFRRARRFVTFAHPAAGVRRLASVKGRVDVLLPLQIETLRFADPLRDPGEKRQAGGYALRLERHAGASEGVSLILKIEAPRERNDAEKRQQAVDIRSRLEEGDVELLDDDGRTHPAEFADSSHASGSADGWTTESHGQVIRFARARGAKELRVRFLSNYFVRRVEFDFRNVELP